MFLLAQEGDLPSSQQYGFRAYDYGPLSAEIYRDLDDLVLDGLVEELGRPGYTWSRYQVTPEGLSAAAASLSALPQARQSAVRHLAEIKREVLRRDFASLLQYVYAKYPAYAENSVFRG
jgi:uncharacterized protein